MNALFGFALGPLHRYYFFLSLSRVAQRQSIRLLIGRLLVRIQSRELLPGTWYRGFFISELISPVLHSEAESARLGVSTRECRVISTKAGEALEEPESSVAGIGPIRIAEG